MVFGSDISEWFDEQDFSEVKTEIQSTVNDVATEVKKATAVANSQLSTPMSPDPLEPSTYAGSEPPTDEEIEQLDGIQVLEQVTEYEIPRNVKLNERLAAPPVPD